MLRKVPIVAYPIIFDNLCSGFLEHPVEKLSKKLSEYVDAQYIYLTNSGTTALFLILKSISADDERKEVIIPAYTATSVVYAIQKAGLKPVLCDISLNDFNMDINMAARLFTEKTLAIIGVHMFGMLNKGLPEFKKSFPEVYTIEDCCQSFGGSAVDGKKIEKLADVSFFSFNRGKNLPVLFGGTIATNNIKLAGNFEKLIGELGTYAVYQQLMTILKLFILAIVVNPLIYGVLNPILSQFKEKPPNKNFRSKKITPYQAGVALSMLEKFEEYSKKRFENGLAIIKVAQQVPGIKVPQIDSKTKPAFNRIPIIFDDLNKRNYVEKKLLRQGIETSRMYYKPLHHLIDLGYRSDEFPNANYLAEHLLTVPCHPNMQDKDIKKIIETISSV